MCGVDFDHFETGMQSASCGSSEIFYHALNSGGIERQRLRVGVGKRDGAGRDGFPSALRFGDEASVLPGARCAAFASGVGELNSGDGSLPQQKLGDAREEGDVVVFPDAEILRADAAYGGDGAGFGEDQRGAADGAAAEMDEMPVVRKAIAAGILAHGRDDDAVAQEDLANL